MRNRRLYFILIPIQLALLGVFHYYAKPVVRPQTMPGQGTAPEKNWKGRAAPNLMLPKLDGDLFLLSQHVGKKVVVLNFFTTWCGPCREEMPELSRFYEANKDKGLILIGIDVGEEEDIVRDFLRLRRLSFPVALDRDRTVANAYGVSAYPTTVLIGSQGQVVLYERGAILNADAVLGDPLRIQAEAIARGKVAGKEGVADPGAAGDGRKK